MATAFEENIDKLQLMLMAPPAKKRVVATSTLAKPGAGIGDILLKSRRHLLRCFKNGTTVVRGIITTVVLVVRKNRFARAAARARTALQRDTL